MIWSYNTEKQAWILSDSDSVVAKIFLKDKSTQINGYIAKTLISSIYTSKGTFRRLTQSNKDWKSKTKKFKTSEERQKYLDIKKSALIRQINNF